MIRFNVKAKPSELMKLISSAPRMARGKMTEAAAKYIIGDMERGAKHYPPYKYVSRKRAYGRTFVSERQRRYVMAMIHAGRIDPGYPHRTGIIQRGWYIKNSGAKATIANDARGVDFVHGDKKQARLNKLAGWRTVSEIAKANIKGAIKAAEQALKEYLKEKDL
jgi:hypothetical protein